MYVSSGYKPIARALNPEIVFNFTGENVEKIRCLLHGLKTEAALLADAKTSHLFDLFAVIINEALQHAQIVPNTRMKRLEDMAKSIKEHEKTKKVMQRLFNLSHNK